MSLNKSFSMKGEKSVVESKKSSSSVIRLFEKQDSLAKEKKSEGELLLSSGGLCEEFHDDETINSHFLPTSFTPKPKKKFSNVFGNAFSRFACKFDKSDKTLKAHESASSRLNAVHLDGQANNNSNNFHARQIHREKIPVSTHAHHHSHLPHLPHLQFLHKYDSSNNDGTASVGEEKSQELLKMLDDAKIESTNIIKKAYKQKDILLQRAKKEAENETKAVRDAVERDFQISEERDEIETAQIIEKITASMNEEAEDMIKLNQSSMHNAVDFVTNTVLTVDLILIPTAVQSIIRQHNLNVMNERKKQERIKQPNVSDCKSSVEDVYAYILGRKVDKEESSIFSDLSQRKREDDRKSWRVSNVFLQTGCYGDQKLQ